MLADTAERLKRLILLALRKPETSTEVLANPVSPLEAARAEAALRRAMARLGVVDRRRKRKSH